MRDPYGLADMQFSPGFVARVYAQERAMAVYRARLALEAAGLPWTEEIARGMGITRGRVGQLAARGEVLARGVREGRAGRVLLLSRYLAHGHMS